MFNSPAADVACVLQNRRPFACAEITGSDRFPKIKGRAAFYTMQNRILLTVLFTGLPRKGKRSFRLSYP